MLDSSQFIFLSFALLFIFAAVVLYSVFFTKKVSYPSWKKTALESISIISSKLNTHDTDKLRQTLIEADKLVDFILKSKKRKGETLGERLKNSQNLFDKSSYHKIWQAHKLRNKLVHEMNFNISQAELKKEIKGMLEVKSIIDV